MSKKKIVKWFPSEADGVWNVPLKVVAYQIGIPEQTVRNNLKKDFPIAHRKIGGRHYFRVADVRKFQEDLFGDAPVK